MQNIINKFNKGLEIFENAYLFLVKILLWIMCIILIFVFTINIIGTLDNPNNDVNYIHIYIDVFIIILLFISATAIFIDIPKNKE